MLYHKYLSRIKKSTVEVTNIMLNEAKDGLVMFLDIGNMRIDDFLEHTDYFILKNCAGQEKYCEENLWLDVKNSDGDEKLIDVYSNHDIDVIGKDLRVDFADWDVIEDSDDYSEEDDEDEDNEAEEVDDDFREPCEEGCSCGDCPCKAECEEEGDSKDEENPFEKNLNNIFDMMAKTFTDPKTGNCEVGFSLKSNSDGTYTLNTFENGKENERVIKIPTRK